MQKKKSIFLGKAVDKDNKTIGAIFYISGAGEKYIQRSSLPAYFKTFDVVNCSYDEKSGFRSKWDGYTISGYSIYRYKKESRTLTKGSGYSSDSLVRHYKEIECKQTIYCEVTERSTILPITDEVIESIGKMHVFESEELNERMLILHKELMKKAKNRNGSKEVGIYWDYTDSSRKPLMITGTEDSVGDKKDDKREKDNKKDLGKDFLKKSKYGSVVFMHNHPKNSIFSSPDLKSFVKYKEIVIMTVICNNGTVHILIKDKEINPHTIIDFHNSHMETKLGGIKSVLHNAKSLGLKYLCVTPNRGRRL